jgi:hypothetical protein
MHLALVLLVGVATAQVCLNKTGYVQPGAPSCVYCNLNGNLVGGMCNCTQPGLSPTCTALSPPNAVSPNSTCGPNLCTDDDDECVLSSRAGARCRECSLAGWINGSTCACYSKAADPSALCTTLVNTQYQVNLLYNVTTPGCNWWNSFFLGYYLNAYACLLPTLGPVPNQQYNGVGSLDQGRLPTECNTYGGPDPLFPALGFATCSGHGTWNASAYACVCSPHWALAPLGIGLNDQNVSSCTACAPNYGPPIPIGAGSAYGSGPVPGQACSVVWAPDPLDGVSKMCSGHGTFLNGVCVCDFGRVLGYWALQTLESGVQTCSTCAHSQTTVSNCTLAFPTASPSLSPVSSAPSRSPSSAPTVLIGLPYLYTVPLAGAIGELGNRTNTSATCLAQHPVQYECTRAVALVCYTTSPVWDLPALANFSASDDIWLPTPQYAWDAESLGNFSTMLSGTKYITVVEASVVTSIPNELFALEGLGCNVTGYTIANCDDFSSLAGDALTEIETFPCSGSALNEILCLCVDNDARVPPTLPWAPTASPTT